MVAPVPAVDDYFNSLDASTRAAFEHIRDLVIEIVPEAEQGTSYGMATRSPSPAAGVLPRRPAEGLVRRDAGPWRVLP
jgi:hypothetical protein